MAEKNFFMRATHGGRATKVCGKKIAAKRLLSESSPSAKTLLLQRNRKLPAQAIDRRSAVQSFLEQHSHVWWHWKKTGVLRKRFAVV
jgi:hypothetical protein